MERIELHRRIKVDLPREALLGGVPMAPGRPIAPHAGGLECDEKRCAGAGEEEARVREHDLDL
ncbi:MAG TPA: hypothetical protein VMH78_01740, partial [Thermoplasmata archaeon]|nr:hypothetical protein [Thermoplasmata archaeon]